VADTDIIFLSCFFLSSFFPRLISAAADWMLPYFDTWCDPSANLECRSETCCTRLAGNAGPKKSPKSRHLDTIAQLRRVSTIGQKLVKQQYLLHMSPQYGELQPTSGWDRSGSLGHLCKFQRVSRLGSVTAWHSSSGRQPNFVAFNRGRRLYLAGGQI